MNDDLRDIKRLELDRINEELRKNHERKRVLIGWWNAAEQEKILLVALKRAKQAELD